MGCTSDDDTPACLLVDDLEENLFALEAVLREVGAPIFKARGGDEALELLLRHEFGVALIDVQMPDMDGLELAETMRRIERTRGVPILFVTAAEQSESRIFRGYEAGGAVDFLYKPIAPHVVRSKVRVFLELERHRREIRLRLRETERALEDAETARRQLVEANRLRERLLAIVSHDLRTPLTAISLLAARGSTGDMALIDRSARRMARMIEDLLDFSRAQQAGGFPIERERCNLVEIARQVVSEIRAANPERAIALDAIEALEGSWDARAVAQVVSNLVGNAVQHGAERPVTVVVRGGAEAILEVHNDGEPIPHELLEDLFEPYRRGQGEPRSRGLGLGLYITREIVRAHGGTIDVRSTRDAGTRFVVRLPLH